VRCYAMIMLSHGMQESEMAYTYQQMLASLKIHS